MSSQESIKCPVCLTPFDAEKRIPKIFPTCGHTVCEKCLLQVLRMGTPKCPLDKLSFGRDFQDIESFPTNFLGKHLLEWNDKWERCSAHPQEISNVICLNDQKLICSDCAIFGDHQGHEIKSLSEAQDLAKAKENQLSGILNQITNHQSQFDKTIKEKEQTIKEIIKERFESLHAAINKHEAQMLFQLEMMLQEENDILKNSALEKKISEVQNKLREFSKMMKTASVMKIVEEDFKDIETEITEGFVLNSQKMEEFTNLLSVFENSLPKEDLFKDLNMTDILDQNLAEFQGKRKFSLEEEEEAKGIEIDSPVAFSLENQVLKAVYYISHLNLPNKFEKSKLEQVQEIEFRLSIRTQKMVDAALPSFAKLLKHLPNVKSASFAFDDQLCNDIIQANEGFHKLLSTTLSRPQSLENLSFNFITNNKYVLGDLGFLFLTENVLPRIKNLRSFSMIIRETQISSRTLKTISRVNWKAWPNLEQFRLDIPEPSLKENDLRQFFNVVPNVKDLVIGLGNTQLADQAIENFSTKILPSFDKLERFEVGLWGTKLTNIGVEKFLMNIPNNIKSLLISLNSLEITEDIIKIFLDKKLPSLTKLEEFCLGVSTDNFTQDTIQLMNDWQKRMKKENDDESSKSTNQTWQQATDLDMDFEKLNPFPRRTFI